ncbi:MAG TPA: pseudouridine synthase [Longimicrobium sp.]
MPRKNPQHHPHGEAVRLQAFLAHSGVASRRHAEELIAGGRVFVNGVSVTAPGTKITPGVDHVEVEGQPVEVQPITWIALHKPKGYVTSRDDPYGRKTVYDLLPEKFHGLFHVGRLDRDSEGILLLTNDGVLANRMLHPSFGVTKEYWADVEGKPTAEQMHRIVEEGVEDEGEHLRAESIRRLHQTGENEHRLSVVLREGKKREVRRMLAALGHPVHRLIRRRFGPISLGELKPGKWRVVTEAELATLRKGRGDMAQGTGDRAMGGERPPRRRPAEPDTADAAPPRQSTERRATHGKYARADKSPRETFTRFEKLRRGDQPARDETPARGGGRAEKPERGAKRGERAARGEKPERGAKRAERVPGGEKPERGGKSARAAKPGDRTRKPAERATASRRGDDKPRRASQRGDDEQRPWEAPKPRKRPAPGKPSPRRERDEEETPARGPGGERGPAGRGRSGDERPRARRDRDEETPRSQKPPRTGRPSPRRDQDEETPRRGRGERDADRPAKPGKPRGAAPRSEAEDDVRGPGYGRRGTTKPGVRAARDREEEEARRPSRPSGGGPRGGSRPGGRGGAAKGESPARGGGKPGGARPPRGASMRDDDEGASPRGGGGRPPRKGGPPRGRR